MPKQLSVDIHRTAKMLQRHYESEPDPIIVAKLSALYRSLSKCTEPIPERRRY